MEKNNCGQVKWTSSISNEKKDAGPKYSRFSESLRHVAPSAIQCSMFCGGRQCKYENPTKMKDEEMAIKGLYSSWVTSDILATARPSTEIINKYDVIAQFCQMGIKSLMNLQHPGEHASCGYGLEDSGFSYVPEDFMQSDIFFYNFGWNDYGVRSLESILDMVKVMSFALKEGKAAVHCHAGLGRTGVLIACYLIFSERLEAEEAIHRVRANRPKAVQTRGQIACVNDFTNFLSHLWIVFPSCVPGAKRFTLQQYLTRQRHLLHGEESRQLKHVPKVVYLLCCRLLEVAGVKGENTPLTWTLSKEVKAVFAEVEDTEVLKKHTVGSVEDMAHAVNHSPYVDSALSSSQATILQYSQSVDAVEEDETMQEVTGSVLGPLEEHLLGPREVSTRNRRCSDSDIITRGSDIRPWGSQLIPPPSRSPRLEPLNLSARSKEKKQKGRRLSKLRSQASTDASTGGIGAKEQMKGFLSAAQQNVGLPAIEERNAVAKALASSACADPAVHNRTDRLKRKLNASDCWEEIRSESDPWVLTRLLWSWLEELAEPVLTEAEVALLEENMIDPVRAVKKLKRGERDTLECLVTIICELEPLRKELADRVLRRTAVVLTHNKELSLTLPRASLDKSAELPGTESMRYSPQSPAKRGISEDREDEAPSYSESLQGLPSYRLLAFLRKLVQILKGSGEMSRT